MNVIARPSLMLCLAASLAGVALGSQYHGFLYNNGIFTTINDPSGSNTNAYGINDAGQIVGSYLDIGGVSHGFVDVSGVFTTLDDPSGTNTVAYGINNAGQIVGGYQDAGGILHGFLDSGGIFVTIDDPLSGGDGTYAYGINDAGQIVGSFRDASRQSEGFLDTGGTFTTVIDPLQFYETVLFGINNGGQSTGVYQDASGIVHGFRYSEGIFAPIEYPAGVDTFAYGINSAGEIVGSWGTPFADGIHGFLDNGGVFTDLKDPLATGGETLAHGINDSGLIVGSYIGDLVFPAPEPSTFAMVLTAALLGWWLRSAVLTRRLAGSTPPRRPALPFESMPGTSNLEIS
jgi:probable HAF family extracellular repeat protein